MFPPIKGNKSTRDIHPLEWHYRLKATLKIDFAICFFYRLSFIAYLLLPNWRLRWKSYDWLTNHGFSTMAFRWIPDTYTLSVYTLKNPMHIEVLYSLILQVIQLNTSDLNSEEARNAQNSFCSITDIEFYIIGKIMH